MSEGFPVNVDDQETQPKVLLVDDDEVNLLLTSIALRERGFAISEASRFTSSARPWVGFPGRQHSRETLAHGCFSSSWRRPSSTNQAQRNRGGVCVSSSLLLLAPDHGLDFRHTYVTT
ncbi:MAG: response regulator [Aquabacterium sp.]